ncbi:uncharacterized protein K02A2.6-like [Ostrea edulis]|uniref:uncharacterized protein K02A2.6-like n=1 Tax=Ostrea edulis TaxID=37623 RepID=UPI0024AFF048|nr:uncharacterized protein K02A2.6-like [Ostrea edulis]
MKVPALLSLIGGKTYSLLRDLTSPEKPAEKNFEDIVKLLKDHLSPRPSVIAERFRFNRRQQMDVESVNEYVAKLRKLAECKVKITNSEYCEFGNNLNDTLRDRIVCGLNNEQIQRQLLSKTTLTLQKAIDIAVAMETASKDTQELRDKQVSVNKLSHQHNYQQKTDTPQPSKCIRCNGKNHASADCYFKDAVCRKCNNKGHIKRACLTKGKHKFKTAKQKKYVRNVDKTESDDSDSSCGIEKLSMNSVIKADDCPILLNVRVNGKDIQMELDTGSAVSVISEEKFREIFGKQPLKSSNIKLRTYSGEKLKSVGVLDVNVEQNGQSVTCELYVVKKGTTTLFERSWLKDLKLDWKNVKSVMSVTTMKSESKSKVQAILQKYSSVFRDGIGRVKGIKANLHLNEDAKPIFCKARPVPYAMKPKIEQELENLENMGILEKVDTREWATPIVTVPKKNGNVRICGDFKVTINLKLNVDQYPLPKIEDIFASLSHGEHFSKIDLRQAYLHMEMEEKSKAYLTINTHKRLYRYNRLLYGVASAPSIWQRTMDQILQGIPGVHCILDDMIVTGKTEKEHLRNLDSVLQRLQNFGLEANFEKCKFFSDSVKYCGHEVTKEGIWKT